MKNLICLLTLGTLPCFGYAATIVEPKIKQFNSIEFHSDDELVKTLEAVDVTVDLFAARDDVFTLKAREKNLISSKGIPFSVFGYNKAAELVVAAHDPVAHVNLVGKENDSVIALFYDKDNKIIAPDKAVFQLFDFDFKPVAFDYTPSRPPQNITFNVDLLIDVSGSMKNHLNYVTKASAEFMKSLPSFTRCSVITFGSTIEHLTDKDPRKLTSCPSSITALDNGLHINGMTALHLALKQSMESKAHKNNGLPNLKIVLTDGADTENPEITVEQLSQLKQNSNSSVLFFWAGIYNDHLKSLADIETISTQSINQDLESFFKSIGISINGLQTLILK